MSCEGKEIDTSKGYVAVSLIEVNGKQRIDRTTELHPCRVKEIWIFDFTKKEVLHSFDEVDCPRAPWIGNATEPFDTGYISHLRGRFLSLPLSTSVFATSPPLLHKNFPLVSLNSDPNGMSGIDYPLVKFDRQELILRNHFDYLQATPDTQFFELTLKYKEH